MNDKLRLFEIIADEYANEVCFDSKGNLIPELCWSDIFLIKFADLVRADEREACERLLEDKRDSLERQWQNDEINERIDQLVIKAAGGPLSYDDEGDWYLSEKEVKKFAELIVKECCNWINGSPSTDAGQLMLTK